MISSQRKVGTVTIFMASAAEGLHGDDVVELAVKPVSLQWVCYTKEGQLCVNFLLPPQHQYRSTGANENKRSKCHDCSHHCKLKHIHLKQCLQSYV